MSVDDAVTLGPANTSSDFCHGVENACFDEREYREVTINMAVTFNEGNLPEAMGTIWRAIRCKLKQCIRRG